MNTQRVYPKPSNPEAHPETGFTLIEVLVVVLMVAIIMAIAAPSWMSFLSQRRMTVVRDDLIQKLEEAQSRAKQQRTTQSVTIYPTETVPTVSIGNTPGQGGRVPLGSGDIPANTIELVANSTSITFDYQGAVDTQYASVPFIVKVRPTGSNVQRCVAVITLVGTVKPLNGTACDASSFTP